MKKFSNICSLMVALAVLFACTAVAVAAEKSQIAPGSQNQQTQPVFVRQDISVNRVFISAADAPGVPVSGALSEGGNYVLNCEISRLVSVASSAPIIIEFAYKVDGFILHDEARSFAPNETKTISSPLSAYEKTKAFSVGSHTLECYITNTNVIDSAPSNNTKSMTYTVQSKVQKIFKPMTDTMQKK